jgi:N-acetylglutamate synthase-like GNAT family acetyltransferase
VLKALFIDLNLNILLFYDFVENLSWFTLVLVFPSIIAVVTTLITEFIRVLLSRSTCWIIECNGCLVAYIMLNINKECSVVSGLFVESAWRKKGLASCLIKRLIQEAPKPTYLKPIYLGCRKNLVRFYARFGFVLIPGKELPKSLLHWKLLDNNYSIIMRYR